MQISNELYYVGVNDKEIDLFEGQYIVPNGMAYNSYVIVDDKIAVFDTVSENFTDTWLDNIKNVIGNRKPDYLIVQHMEPDHSANIENFMNVYPNTKIVASSKAFQMIGQFFNKDYKENQMVVSDGSTLCLGKHTLSFYTAPMVHWPEVIMTYDSATKTLFSADAFGKFGSLDTDEDWACEARRYYFGIVGKYGQQVQALLKKLGGLDIQRICALHGPILDNDLPYYLNLYNTWSSYTPEAEGVTICYTSVYGHTKKAVLKLCDMLKEKGCKKVALFDLARDDIAEAVEDSFKYGKLVLATTTYNSDIFPFMRTLIEALVERNYSNRKIAFVENGSWAPTAAKVMRKMFENSKNLDIWEGAVKIKGSMTKENEKEMADLCDFMLN